MTVDDPELYCRVCNIKFKSWEQLKKHRLDSSKHNACIFCAADFRTQDGRKRHQDQQHAAAQNLECYGCGEKFKRAGSYVNHIEMRMCPKIHPIEFQRRRNETTLMLQRMRVAGSEKLQTGTPQPSKAGEPSQVPQPKTQAESGSSDSTDLPYVDTQCSIYDDDLLIFDDNPERPAWGVEEEGPMIKKMSLLDLDSEFPSLSQPTKVDKGKGRAQDPPLPTGDKLNVQNKAWVDHKAILPNAPKPVSPINPKQIQLQEGKKEDEWHELDPGNPTFNARRYFNPYNSKYKCPWTGCKSLLPNANALRSHLQSAAHMNLKLRCPSCLRMFFSYTALVQHAESQAKKCDIRNSTEYKYALDEVGSLVTVAGAHAQDATKIYKANTADEIAEADALASARALNAAAMRDKKKEEVLSNMVW